MTVTAIGAATAVDGRTIEGVAVPYDELSYLTPNPMGERVLPGAFAKSIARPSGDIFLFRGHDHAQPYGKAVHFEERSDGLYGWFHVRETPEGDRLLLDVRDGYLPAMSVGFRPVRTRRGRNGETEIVEAQLKEVSLVSIGAYDGARVLALRTAQQAAASRMTFRWHVPPQWRDVLRS